VGWRVAGVDALAFEELQQLLEVAFGLGLVADQVGRTGGGAGR
jgi:hypothetical protein